MGNLNVLGLGPKLIEKLHQSQLDSLESLLRHYPSRYETIEEIPFSNWKKGDRIALEGQNHSAGQNDPHPRKTDRDPLHVSKQPRAFHRQHFQSSLDIQHHWHHDLDRQV